MISCTLRIRRVWRPRAHAIIPSSHHPITSITYRRPRRSRIRTHPGSPHSRCPRTWPSTQCSPALRSVPCARPSTIHRGRSAGRSAPRPVHVGVHSATDPRSVIRCKRKGIKLQSAVVLPSNMMKLLKSNFQQPFQEPPSYDLHKCATLTWARCTIRTPRSHSSRLRRRRPGAWDPCRRHGHGPCLRPNRRSRCRRPRSQSDHRLWGHAYRRPPGRRRRRQGRRHFAAAAAAVAVAAVAVAAAASVGQPVACSRLGGFLKFGAVQKCGYCWCCLGLFVTPPAAHWFSARLLHRLLPHLILVVI